VWANRACCFVISMTHGCSSVPTPELASQIATLDALRLNVGARLPATPQVKRLADIDIGVALIFVTSHVAGDQIGSRYS